MKKLILLLFVCFYANSEDITIFSDVGFDCNANQIKIQITYLVDADSVILQISDSITLVYLELTPEVRLQFTNSILKALEWEKIAKDNDITDVLKPIADISSKTFFYCGDWYNAGNNIFRIAFVYNEKYNLSGITVYSENLVDTENYYTIPFSSIYIPIFTAGILGLSMQDCFIRDVINLAAEETAKIDLLFK